MITVIILSKGFTIFRGGVSSSLGRSGISRIFLTLSDFRINA
jgi:hypothetical protein